MNGKRAKQLRKLVAGFDDLSDTAKYDSIEFKRPYTFLKTDALGRSEEVKSSYPVRTIFLVKCKRAAYKRLKRKDRAFQNQMLTLVQSM